MFPPLKASDFSNVGDWPMLIGGKPTGNETKRSTKKQRSQVQKDYNNTNTASSAEVENSSASASEDKDNTVVSIDSPNSTESASSSGTLPKDKENNDPKSSNGQASQATTAGSSEAASSSNGGNGIHKKIPKHKWRPLQIDLAKSSRSKSIGRPTRRGISSAQQRNYERANQRGDINGSERRSNVYNSHEMQRERYAGPTKRSGGPNERIDSWRSGSGAERSNDREYERPARTQRRFRTAYRGGRQGRGGFSRSGPGRTANRIPRHLLTNGEFANYLPADAAGTDQSFILMGTHYYGPMPTAYIEMDAQSVKEAIKKQV